MKSICKIDIEEVSSEPLRVLALAKYVLYKLDRETGHFAPMGKDLSFEKLDEIARGMAEKDLAETRGDNKDFDHNALDSWVAENYHVMGYNKENNYHFDFTSMFQDMIDDWDYLKRHEGEPYDLY